MLARLDALPGVALARTDTSGTYLLLELTAGADPAAAEAAALRSLPAGARRLPQDEAEDQLAALRRGDPWLSAAEVPGLSYLEARLLSVRVAGEAGRALGLGPRDRARLCEVARQELFRAVERVHREGGRESSGWFFEAWPEVAGRIAGRFPGGPGHAGHAALEDALAALFPPPGQGPSGAAPPSARVGGHGEGTA